MALHHLLLVLASLAMARGGRILMGNTMNETIHITAGLENEHSMNDPQKEKDILLQADIVSTLRDIYSGIEKTERCFMTAIDGMEDQVWDVVKQVWSLVYTTEGQDALVNGITCWTNEQFFSSLWNCLEDLTIDSFTNVCSLLMEFRLCVAADTIETCNEKDVHYLHELVYRSLQAFLKDYNMNCDIP